MISKLKAIVMNEASCEVDACVIITQQEHNEVGICHVTQQSFASSLEEPYRSDDEFSNYDLDGDEDDTDIGFGTCVYFLTCSLHRKLHVQVCCLVHSACIHTCISTLGINDGSAD